MAEGGIEGEADDYAVAAAHSTSFRFSRFDAASAPAPLEMAPPLAQAASAY